jgi:hypothetical protein
MMKNDYGKAKFRVFAKEKRLRLARDGDGLPIVVARGKEYAGSQLFEGFGTKHVGFLLVRSTAGKLSRTYGSLVRRGYEPILRAECEAVFKIPYGPKGKTLMKIAREFKMVKKRYKAA